METNVIYNEDCYVGIKSIPDNSIDLVITSPPYLNSRDYTDTYMLELKTLGFTQNVGIGFFTQDAGNSMTITDYTITCGNKVISGLGTCQATLTEVTE